MWLRFISATVRGSMLSLPSQPAGGAGTAVVTIIADSPRMSEDQPPESKRLKLGPALQPTLQSALQPAIHPPRPLASTPPGQTLSNSEVSAVRQLITGEAHIPRAGCSPCGLPGSQGRAGLAWANVIVGGEDFELHNGCIHWDWFMAACSYMQ